MSTARAIRLGLILCAVGLLGLLLTRAAGVVLTLRVERGPGATRPGISAPYARVPRGGI